MSLRLVGASGVWSSVDLRFLLAVLVCFGGFSRSMTGMGGTGMDDWFRRALRALDMVPRGVRESYHACQFHMGQVK